MCPQADENLLDDGGYVDVIIKQDSNISGYCVIQIISDETYHYTPVILASSVFPMQNGVCQTISEEYVLSKIQMVKDMNDTKEKLQTGRYHSNLIYRHVAVSSYIPDFTVEIQNNELFIDNTRIGTIEPSETSKNLWYELKEYYQYGESDILQELSNLDTGWKINMTFDYRYAKQIFLTEFDQHL